MKPEPTKTDDLRFEGEIEAVEEFLLLLALALGLKTGKEDE